MYPNPMVRPGLFASLKSLNWSGILDGTQKTLGVINQAIPIVYQVKPVISNMKSLFTIASAINSPDTNSQKSTRNTNMNTNPNRNNTNSTNTNSNINPIFYI